MKKIILTTIILLAMKANSQNLYISFGADVRNAITGSNATNDKPELDMMFKFGMVGNEGIEVAIGFEKFKALDFEKYFFAIGYQIPISNKIIAVPNIQPVLINRSGDWGGGLTTKDNNSGHLSLGFSLPVRYSINDNISIEWQPDLLWRTDIKAKYGNENWDGLSIGKTPVTFSNYISIIYKFQP